MTDQHPEMTKIEMVNALIGMAAGVRAFYEALLEEGFDHVDALKLTLQYVHGMVGGRA
jgi:hypothetical protein